MIEYFDLLSEEEQADLTEIIQLFYRQTFLLEHKYDKKTERYQYSKEYRTALKHKEFLKEYFGIAGIELSENVHMGILYIQGETLWGEKLPRLATIYMLVLKLLYDEQMEEASSSMQIVTTLGAVNAMAGSFHVLRSMPSPTEMRRAVAFLKKYQVIEPMDVLEELNEDTRMIIYPSVNVVLMGDDIRELLKTFDEEEERGEEAAIQSTIEDLSE